MKKQKEKQENTFEDLIEIVEENIENQEERKIDINNLKKINDLLSYFEKEHLNDTTKKGKRLIKREFLIREKL